MKTINSSDLLNLLRTLSKAEMKELKKWINSPWCNTNGRLPKLYDALANYHPDFDKYPIRKEEIFRKVLKGKPFNDRWLRNLMAELHKSIQEFIVCQRTRTQENLHKQILIQEYIERNLHKAKHKTSTELIQSVEKKKPKSPEDYWLLTFLFQNHYYNTYHSGIKETGIESLHKASCNLNQLFLTLQSRFFCEFAERNLVLENTEAIDEEISKILSYLSTEQPGLQGPGFYLARLSRQKQQINVANFQALKKSFFKLDPNLLEKDREIMMHYLINDGSRLVRQKHEFILQEIFEIYKFALQQDILMPYDQMSERTYINIVAVANSLSEFQFNRDFIRSYQNKLAADLRDDAYLLADAQTDFYEGKYFDCVSKIKDFSSKVPSFNNRVRLLLLQAFYEIIKEDKTYFSILASYCKSFQNRLLKQQTSIDKRDAAFLNFSNHLFQLARFSLSPNRKQADLQTMAENLTTENNVQARKWLWQKIKELTGED